MKPKELEELTDGELLEAAKKIKPTELYDSVIFGVLIGIAIYSTVTNGFDLLTFLPLIYLPVAGKNKAKQKEMDQLLSNRNLK